MKTLDEVIEKYEICNRSDICCSECPFFRDICSCDPDALHYLKEYRETKKHLAIREVSSELLMLESLHHGWQAYRKERA